MLFFFLNYVFLFLHGLGELQQRQINITKSFSQVGLKHTPNLTYRLYPHVPQRGMKLWD